MRILTDHKLNKLLKQARRQALHLGFTLGYQLRELEEREESQVLKEVDKIRRGKHESNKD